MNAEQMEHIICEMTLEEKVLVLAGADNWYTEPVERLGIPAIKTTDGPNGARGEGRFDTAVPGACFPVGIALGATWNIELLEQIGGALAEECKSKGAHVLLAPTVNIHRSTLSGRNFECYSEDPHLTTELALAYIKGLQDQGIGATIKHFVCNDSEFERRSISSEVDERTLREIYLPPFKAAVKKGHVWAIMSAYNRLNGTHCSCNAFTLQTILRDEWGFDGLVMSDWWGTKSTAQSVNAGQDLEMPGPPLYRGEKLLQAVKDGEVTEATLDTRILNLLRLIDRVGAFDNPEIPAERTLDRPEDRALIRQAGAEAAVLLKNDGVLPLDTGRLQKLAVIGPNAKTAQFMGGGSALLKPLYSVTPYEGIVNHVPETVEVGYAIGCTNHRKLPPMDISWFEGGALHGDYFNSLDLSGEVVAQVESPSTQIVWFGSLVPKAIDQNHFSARLNGLFSVPEDGTYVISLWCSGKARMTINGSATADNWTQPATGPITWGEGSGEAFVEIKLAAGQKHSLLIEYSSENTDRRSSIRLGCFVPLPDDAIEQAAALAAESDVALVFVGLTNEWESEGFDRHDIDLVGRQVELIEQVAAANPNTVVVLQTGSPVTMPWLDKVAALVQAWYPGQECGNAIADVLFGDVPPSGRLPQTFLQRIEDNPAFINYPGENGRVRYGEGIFVGYRYYDKKRIEPLFPFGFGLTYTTFEYSNLRLSADSLHPKDRLEVLLDITNSGPCAGQEVVQLYVHDPQSQVMRPEKELKAFTKIALQPQETRTVRLTLDRAAFAFFDDLKRAWVAEAGEYDLLVGASSRDIRVSAAVTLTDTLIFDPAV